MAHDLALASGIATALVPGALGFALSRALRAGARTARFLTSASAALAAAGAALCAGSLAVAGTAASGGGFAYVDGLTALLLLTVTLIGAVVARYSVRYLDGSPGQAAFSQWLSFVLSGVGLTLVAGNLAVFLAGSTATSLGLHRLLCYNAERPAAVLAARERFLLARVGDALLVIACALAYLQFGTLEFASIVGAVEAGGGIASGLMAFLLVGWAVTQSAQLPFHTWLPDTMEAPTPVSALMHAGIVNAGGYLLIRTSPILVAEPSAMVALAVVGTATAAFGALVMLTQTEIKAKYAYSTVSQMGFMVLQCGLGAFGAAALHLVGHSFYKAHAFLTAASAVDPEPPVPRLSDPVRLGAATGATAAGMAIAAAVGVAAVASVALALGVDPATKPGAWVLVTVLALATGQLLQLGVAVGRVGPAEDAVRARVTRSLVLAAFALPVAYFGATAAARAILGTAVPGASAIPALPAGVTAAILGVFTAAAALQCAITLAAQRGSGALGWGRAAHVHLRNGLYVEALKTRLVQRLWPLDGVAPRARAARARRWSRFTNTREGAASA